MNIQKEQELTIKKLNAEIELFIFNLEDKNTKINELENEIKLLKEENEKLKLKEYFYNEKIDTIYWKVDYLIDNLIK